MLMTKASVVIPLFNKSSSVLRCLGSVFSQSFKSFEVIVVDDGSTDGSVSLVKKSNFKLTIISQENRGVSAARNAGLSACKGEFITFLDADDYWEPEFLATCIEYLMAHPQVVAVNTASKAIGWKDDVHFVPRYIESPDHDKTIANYCEKNFFNFWAHYDHVRTGSVVIRRHVVEQSGGFQADFPVAEDLEYWGYIATFGSWGFIPQPLFVTDGTTAAVSEGWLAKLKLRGKYCPSVEKWQQRILSKLTDERSLSAFKVVRGRVALNFTYIKILAGLHEEARHVIRTFGEDFPANNMSKLLINFSKNMTSWIFCCYFLYLREVMKNKFLIIKYSFKGHVG